MERPLVFYSISLFLGCFFSIIFNESTYITLIIMLVIHIVIYLTLREINFTIIMFLFSILGIISFNLYFSFQPKTGAMIRINNKYDYRVEGTTKGRKLILKGNIKKLEEGQLIKVESGDFKRNVVYEKGIIGEYNIQHYVLQNRDFRSKIYNLKRNINNKFINSLGKKRGSIVVSLCFGDSSYLEKEDKDNIKKLGVIHALSVSGFHLALVYKIFEIIFTMKFAIIASYLYLAFTGFKYSTIRAFIMILVLKLSDKFYGEYDSLSSISLAFLIILFLKPYAFMEIGFMLSFLSTLGILMFNKKISKYIYFLPSKLNSAISLSLSSQIFLIPYSSFTLKELSIGFLLGNIFLMPIFSMIIIIGVIGAILCPFKYIFNVVVLVLKNLCIILEGATYILIKVCPDLIYIEEIFGIFIISIYICFMMYKAGKVKYKYLPLFLLVAVFFNAYTVFPKVYILKNEKVKATIIKYKDESIMYCDYDLEEGKYIIELKDNFNIDKVITNAKGYLPIHIKENKLKAINFYKEYFHKNIDNYEGYDIICMKSNDYKEYKIIFGKIFRIR
ncbi:ComEC/Rec2 family competence protein [Clostridium tetani]|uniref:ComEC/Rec2 family competence protein n=2 Tax=Clostridium tetani TaxID=1513 RepID=UPI00100B1109|nr:ComEC/Rec2 family competence protein [Clostridium tetani]RXI47163.1 ComEC/Rec2 family competence protein [Clostridium tetani]RXI53317.1 ComEC/Rec2 family competence protein [Clostridium tetani]RXM58448.1 ComEC/Rec2 family competence protein [Clostridium tetani]RXM62432.1 ComEC/Rec2 family competence protein [Clostridium tetani]RXM70480.1 ComEC/Rec2 family competence protein [Clostridium tetani]